MNGYSKIKIFGTARSRSMDFSDLSLAFPEPTKSNTEPQETHKIVCDHDNTKKNMISTGTTTQDSLSVLEEDEETNVGEGFGVKLRSSSVSSSASALQSAVKKAFAARRSCSVSERYCRIHDQSATLSSPIHDEDGTLDTMESTRSVTKKHSRGRFLKVCKKLFGL
ncbi:PREDICTED: uncharacterized protein LOC105142118 [Populus euphratica]|uniref:Uncharacterized protein LOC105142118 n=1 Tax=Populus euphratica TaxID=75702 RepID=A0AAJ6VHR6_POPEU|nr:PREDICTED: uncharacterized protein LOC105142118 [Populus euphratica]